MMGTSVGVKGKGVAKKGSGKRQTLGMVMRTEGEGDSSDILKRPRPNLERGYGLIKKDGRLTCSERVVRKTKNKAGMCPKALPPRQMTCQKSPIIPDATFNKFSGIQRQSLSCT